MDGSFPTMADRLRALPVDRGAVQELLQAFGVARAA